MATRTLFPQPGLQESARIQRFWNDHYAELLAQHPEQFVAVKDDKVVAAADDLALLYYQLRDMGLDARTDVAIEYISSKSASLLL
ncbi:MAG TPA: DUF5678 domain-containing protein [Tepidiformaceae bacterium]